MKRAIATLFLLAIFFPGPGKTQAQGGQFCHDYTGNFGSMWNIEAGTSGGAYSVTNILNSDKSNIGQASIHSPFGTEALSEYRAHFGPAGNLPFNPNPITVRTILYRDNSIIYDESATYQLPDLDQSWTLDIRVSLPDVVADYIRIRVTQPTVVNNVATNPFIWQVRRLCGQSPFPTATSTPIPTNILPTNTSGPSDTPYPTATTRPSTTPRPTRSLVPSWTPRTPSATPVPTDTQEPSATPTGTVPTDTPGPSRSPYPTTTLVPTETSAPQQSTFAGDNFNTPAPPQADCTNWDEPCEHFQRLELPTVSFGDTPTIVALLPTLTPLASTTPRELALTGTPVIIVGQLDQLVTAVSGLANVNAEDAVLNNAEGTPVHVAQAIYESGASIGSFWATLRGLTTSDAGPVGGLLLFLLAMIVINIQIRILLFVLPIVIKVIQFIASLIGSILKLLAVLGLIALLLAPISVHAATPTPTHTPPPTWTPTGTLYAPQATATSKYRGLRQTPTPLSIQIDPQITNMFDMTDESGMFADIIINQYRLFNSGHVLHMVSFFVLLSACIILLVNMFRRLNREVK